MAILQKTRREYHSPRVVTAQVDTMSTFCTSVRFKMYVDELHNMNAGDTDDGTEASPFYFEF